MGTVLIGLIGLTVDFTRAQSLRTEMQNAADGAALVAERSATLPMSQRTSATRAFLDAEVGYDAQNVTLVLTHGPDAGHRVVANVSMSLAGLICNQDTPLTRNELGNTNRACFP